MGYKGVCARVPNTNTNSHTYSYSSVLQVSPTLVCRRASEQYVSQGGIAVYVLRRRCVAVFLRS